MPLITCKDCNRDVSDKAPACPNCGCPVAGVATSTEVPVQAVTAVEPPAKAGGMRYLGWLGAGFAGFIVIGLLGTLLPDKTKPAAPEAAAPAGQPAEAPTPTATEAPAAPTGYTKVTIGGQELAAGIVDDTVHAVESAVYYASLGNQIFNEQPDGQFLVVKLIVRNDTKETRTIGRNSMTLLDAQGNTFHTSTKGATALVMAGDKSAELVSTQVQPTVSKRVTIVFDLPATATDLSTLKLHVPSGGFGADADVPLGDTVAAGPPPGAIDMETSGQDPSTIDANSTGGTPVAAEAPVAPLDRAGAETAINTTYRNLAAKLSTGARRKLVSSELKWIKFKDLDVTFTRAWQGGAAAEARYVDMTVQRAAYLEEAYMTVAQVPAGSDTFLSVMPYGTADAALNAAYGALVPRLDKRSRKALLSSQLAWIKFRDAEADFWPTWSRDASARQTCLATLTELRTRDLEAFAR